MYQYFLETHPSGGTAGLDKSNFYSTDFIIPQTNIDSYRGIFRILSVTYDGTFYKNC